MYKHNFFCSYLKFKINEIRHLSEVLMILVILSFFRNLKILTLLYTMKFLKIYDKKCIYYSNNWHAFGKK